jgi:hypothetical protein
MTLRPVSLVKNAKQTIKQKEKKQSNYRNELQKQDGYLVRKIEMKFDY